jgi:hypothetical protein
MNSKAKGSRRERQSRDFYLRRGWLVCKAGGSLGAFDLVCVYTKGAHDVDPGGMVHLVQVKSNRPPSAKETAELERLAGTVAGGAVVLLHVWTDRRGLEVTRPGKPLFYRAYTGANP